MGVDMNEEYIITALNIRHRQGEVAAYQRNIDTYLQMLVNLPQGEPPDDIRVHINTPADKLPLDVPQQTVMQVADYQLRARLQQAIRAEMVQQNIVQHTLNAQTAQIPAELYAEALAAADLRLAAAV